MTLPKYVIVKVIIFSSINVVANTRNNSSNAVEETPSATIFACPNKTLLYPDLPLTTEEKKQLQIVVHGVGSQNKIKYNYYEMHKLKGSKSIDWKKKIVIYAMAYYDHPGGLLAAYIEENYAKLGYNVWLLDTFLLTTGDFHRVSRKMRSAGYAIAKKLADLSKSGLLDPSRLEIVGFSLGCQTAGYIGAKFQQLVGKKLHRITGIDPAGFCFRDQPAEYRLDKTDADFVDIIHTNIDGFGMVAAVGHVDFYVNGGEDQNSGYPLLLCLPICKHVRAFQLWIAALQNPNGFIGIRCNTVQQARSRNCYVDETVVTNVMGLKSDPTKPGIFYLPTKASPPYYLGEDGLAELLKKNSVSLDLEKMLITPLLINVYK